LLPLFDVAKAYQLPFAFMILGSGKLEEIAGPFSARFAGAASKGLARNASAMRENEKSMALHEGREHPKKRIGRSPSQRTASNYLRRLGEWGNYMSTPEVRMKHGGNNIYKIRNRKALIRKALIRRALIRRNNIKEGEWTERDKTHRSGTCRTLCNGAKSRSCCK
jgi:hypothetical protein